MAEMAEILNKNLENPSVQAETSSLMPYLCSFPCMQASRQKHPDTSSISARFHPEQKKNRENLGQGAHKLNSKFINSKIKISYRSR